MEITDPTGQGRHVSCLKLIDGDFYYRGQLHRVDEEYLARIVNDFEVLLATGWTSPILIEHEMKGERHGDVFALFASGKTLSALVAWADKDAEAQIAAGKWRDVSVGLYTVEHAATGLELYTVLEVSRTAVPHMNHLGRMIASQHGAKQMTLTEMLAGLEARLKAIEAAMKPAEAPTETAEEEEDEDAKAIEAALSASEEDEMLAGIDAKFHANLKSVFARDKEKAKSLAAKIRAHAEPRKGNPANLVNKTLSVEEVVAKAKAEGADELTMFNDLVAKGYTIKGL
jgi:hypothetical protein